MPPLSQPNASTSGNASKYGAQRVEKSRKIAVDRHLLSNLLECNEYEINDRIQQSTNHPNRDSFDSELDSQILACLYADRAELRHLLELDKLETVTIVGDAGTFAVTSRGVPKGALPKEYRHILRIDLPTWYAENPESAVDPTKTVNLRDLGYTYRDGNRLRYQSPERACPTHLTVLS